MKTQTNFNNLLAEPDFIQTYQTLTPQDRIDFLTQLTETTEKDIIPGAFRSYDIRIDANKLPNHVVFYIGLKVLYLLKEIINHDPQKTFGIAIGSASPQARPSSERIKKTYMNALSLAGAKVIDLGITTTPDIYFAAAYLKEQNIHAVVNITASHNPRQDNGLKHCVITPEGYIHSIDATHMDKLKLLVLPGNPQKTKTDQLLKENLKKPTTIPPPEPFSTNPDTLSHLHHAYLTLIGILGAPLLTELNKKNHGNFQRTLKTFLPDPLKESSLAPLQHLYHTPWETILKQLNLPNLPPPAHHTPNPLKDFIIILDYAKGTAYRSAEIYRFFGANIIELTEDRPFNPMEPRNQTHLKKILLETAKQNPQKEVIGFAHDEDGDRLLTIRSNGTVVEGDRLLVIVAQETDPQIYQGKTPLVITEVKSRPETRQTLEQKGFKVLIVPTGFAFIKEAAIRIEKAIKNYKKGTAPSKLTLYQTELDLDKLSPPLLWAELSGHFGFQQDYYYLFDDATLMALTLLFALHHKIQKGTKPGQALHELDQSFPRYPSSGELNLFVRTQNPEHIPTNEEKQALVDELENQFRKNPEISQIDKTDGIQILFQENQTMNGWILIRKSNNEDKLVVVTSAPTNQKLNHIEKIFLQTAKQIKTPVISGLVLTEKDQQGHERHPDPYIQEKMKLFFQE